MPDFETGGIAVSALTGDDVDLLEPVSSRFVDRIDQTAGSNWMPAARNREVRA